MASKTNESPSMKIDVVKIQRPPYLSSAVPIKIATIPAIIVPNDVA